MCAYLFPHPLLVYEVGMLKVSEAYRIQNRICTCIIHTSVAVDIQINNAAAAAFSLPSNFKDYIL